MITNILLGLIAVLILYVVTVIYTNATLTRNILREIHTELEKTNHRLDLIETNTERRVV
jgi:hypothetical protein